MSYQVDGIKEYNTSKMQGKQLIKISHFHIVDLESGTETKRIAPAVFIVYKSGGAGLEYCFDRVVASLVQDITPTQVKQYINQSINKHSIIIIK